MFAALAAPFFAQQVYVADDLGEFHLPVRDFYADNSRGESFDWMPSLYGGFYVAGEGQLGGYHPWHWLLYRTLPLGAAFDIELLSSYPFLFAGMYLLLRRLIGRRDAALVGATGVHVWRLQPAALRSSQRDRGRGAFAVATVGD